MQQVAGGALRLDLQRITPYIAFTGLNLHFVCITVNIYFGGYIKSKGDNVLAAAIEGGIAPDTVSGWLALEFVNTIENYRLNERLDFIPDYSQWIRWARYQELISEEEAKSLQTQSGRTPSLATKALKDAQVLRQSLYDLYSALANDRIPPSDSLDILNRCLTQALTRSQVMTGPDGFGWGWAVDAKSLDRMMWPVARSAAELLNSPQILRLRQCGGHACSWLFLDLSKNHTRRWCDMKVCGNRAKSQRHYARKRSSTG